MDSGSKRLRTAALWRSRVRSASGSEIVIPREFSKLSEPHHSVSETICVREARQSFETWRETLFRAVQRVWEEYRFLQKAVVGDAGAIPLPAHCNHKPTRSIVLAAVQSTILGRVSAYVDGRAAFAIRIGHLSIGDAINVSARVAYRIEKDTLALIARIGDILLTRLDGQRRTPNFVIEDLGTHLAARRWLECGAVPALAVLATASSYPREVSPAIKSRTKVANRHKIVGVLFAADRLQPGDKVGLEVEATALESDNGMVADLVTDTDAFEVRESSAEPVASDRQYLLAQPSKDDLAGALSVSNGKPLIAEDSEDRTYSSASGCWMPVR